LSSEDLKDRQEPEEFVKRTLVEPLIDSLGFEVVPETVLPSPSGRKKPDYTIRPKNKDKPIFYVEAEALNIDLRSKEHGISQVEDWLISRASKTDYGIATNGLEWRLLKFDATSAKSKEILKIDLRPLFLKILTSEHIETLPNIDFNVFSGNSLIGWLDESLVVHPLVSLLEDSYIEAKLQDLGTFYQDRIGKIKKLLSRTNLQDSLAAYRKLIDMYAFESGERAVRFRETLDNIRRKFYEIVNDSYLDFLHENGDLKKTELEEMRKSITGMKPFHWKVDFCDVFSKGGFDVVIGNPPYGNILKDFEKKALFHFRTKDASEIAANFVERSLNITKKNGYLGLVLANSIAINKSTSDARSLIRENMSASRMALFGTRPAKVFSGAEIRVMIFLGKRDQPKQIGTIYTTDAIKFTSDKRTTLMANLSFESTDGLTLGKERIGDSLEDISLPKVGNSTIRNILLKLKSKSTIVVKDRINKSGFDKKMEFRKTGGYWLNALERMPYKSTKIELVTFKNEIERDFSILLINSSLFYLYWSTYGNLRDFPLSLLERFPFPSVKLLEKNKEEVEKLKKEITNCLLGCFLKDTGRVGEFRTAQCRETIDEIDDLLRQFYGLDRAQVDFVKKYDSHIRRV
jgi:hypothetical protein